MCHVFNIDFNSDQLLPNDPFNLHEVLWFQNAFSMFTEVSSFNFSVHYLHLFGAQRIKGFIGYLNGLPFLSC